METKDLIQFCGSMRKDQKLQINKIAKDTNQKLIGLYVESFDLLIKKYNIS
jgi:hypothetical protein